MRGCRSPAKGWSLFYYLEDTPCARSGALSVLQLSQGWAILISLSRATSTECPIDGSTLACRDNSCPCPASYRAWKSLVSFTLSNLQDSVGSCLAVCLHTHQAKCCSGCQKEKQPEAARPVSSDPSPPAFCPSWCAEPQARGWHWDRMSIQGKFFP